MYKIEFDKSKDKEYKLPCRKCDGITYHKVFHSVNVHESENEIDVWQDFEIICCQGCRDISFRCTSSCSEDIEHDPKTGEPALIEDVELYPSRIAGRKQVKDMYLLPKPVLDIYKETHGATCSRLNILAGIGIRALVESICLEKDARGHNLEKKIEDLVNKGILSKDNAETLQSTRLLGNKSAHEITPPTDEELDIALDIVENLIKAVYIIPHKATKLPRRMK